MALRGARAGGYYKRALAHYTKKNTMLLTLGALFLLGVVAGTLLLRAAGEESRALLTRLLGGFVEERRSGGLADNFYSALASSMLYAGGVFVCGFCAVAQPVIVAAPFVRGLGFGFSAASLFARYGTAATGFVGVLLLPGCLLSTFAILLCCRNSLRLASLFWGLMRGAPARTPDAHPLRDALLGFAAAAVICAAAALLEAALYILFANSFILR